MLSQPQDLLATIVLGNTFAYASMLAVIIWAASHEQWPMLASVGALLIFVLLGVEAAPKTLAMRAPEFWALRVARPMVALLALTRPVRVVAQGLIDAVLKLTVPKSIKPQSAITDAEYQELLEVACQQGTLAPTEKEIILQIISLDRRTARDVMKPRSQMACISDDLTVEEMIAAARRHKHTRLPIYDETPDTIVGVLNTRVLLLDPQADLADAIEFPSFVPESMNLLYLFKSLQRQQRGLAIVLDEFGGTAGIVSMADILEEIVGEIHGEAEAREFVLERLSEGRWRVSGTLRIEDFQREFPALGDVEGVDTMGGLLARELDVIPSEGQSALFRGLKLTAVAVDERRVKELFVEVAKKR